MQVERSTGGSGFPPSRRLSERVPRSGKKWPRSRRDRRAFVAGGEWAAYTPEQSARGYVPEIRAR